MSITRSSLLFLLVFFKQTIESDIRSVRMSSVVNFTFQCAKTTCAPFVNLAKSNIRQCEMSCLGQLGCKAITYRSVSLNCQLFDNSINQNGNMSFEMNVVTMSVILGTKFPPDLTSTSTSTTTSTSSTTRIPSGGLTKNMTYARQRHVALVLVDGRVFVTGGAVNGPWNSADLCDPATGVWAATASMTDGRQFHTGSFLTGGNIIVTGGYYNNPLGSVEIYNSSTNNWTKVASMNAARYTHTASVLLNGKVLVAGGNG
ncbi:unnamed protein product, partial [Adineta ricciae]